MARDDIYIQHGSYNERKHISLANIKFQKKIAKYLFPTLTVLTAIFAGLVVAFFVGIVLLCYYGFLCLTLKVKEIFYKMKRDEDNKWN
jgi:fatty acid desaturase